jgi:hypothetical protein
MVASYLVQRSTVFMFNKKLFGFIHLLATLCGLLIIGSCKRHHDLKKTQWQLVDVNEPGVYKGDVFIYFITDTTLLSKYTELNRTQTERYALKGDTLFMGLKLADTLLISSHTRDSLVLKGKNISFHFAAMKNQPAR